MLNGVPRTALLPYNSAAMLNAFGQRTFSYDKMHLVPFGEYEPFPFIHQVVTSVSEEVGGFHKGKDRSVGQVSRTAIHFPFSSATKRFIPGKFVPFADRGAQLLINISNDGWFGTSEAAEQHLRMARVRAVENRRWLLRDTNSGITASIDPYGNVTARDAPRRSRFRRSALRFPHRSNHLHAIRRLVRLDVRRWFPLFLYLLPFERTK